MKNSSRRRFASANPNARRYALSQREERELPPQVLNILKDHVGAVNAIVAIQIARQLGYRDDRKVRTAIRLLRERMHLIAMSNGKNPGYFIAETREEWVQFLANIRSRAMADFQLYRDCSRAMIKRWGVEFQPSLFDRRWMNAMEIENAAT